MMQRCCRKGIEMKLTKGSLIVHGDAKTKVIVYGGALLMILLILAIMWFLLGRFGKVEPVVGTVTVKNSQTEITPLQNEIYVTESGEQRDKKRLVPGEIGDTAPTIDFEGGVNVSFDGKSNNGGFFFTIYDENEAVYTEKSESFAVPEEAGKYLVCEEAYWGDAKDNIGVEYYFWIVVE